MQVELQVEQVERDAERTERGAWHEPGRAKPSRYTRAEQCLALGLLVGGLTVLGALYQQHRKRHRRTRLSKENANGDAADVSLLSDTLCVSSKDVAQADEQHQRQASSGDALHAGAEVGTQGSATPATVTQEPKIHGTVQYPEHSWPAAVLEHLKQSQAAYKAIQEGGDTNLCCLHLEALYQFIIKNQTAEAQQELKALGVLDWIFAEIKVTQRQQAQQVFESMEKQEQPGTLAEQRGVSPNSIAAVHSAADWSTVNSRAPGNPTASMAAMAESAGEHFRGGSLYSPPGPASSSAARYSSRLRPASVRAAGQSHMLAEQSRNISPTKRPLVPLLERVKSKSPPTDKVQATAKARDDSLEDAYRDENRPPTVTRSSPSPVSNEAGGRSIPPGFVSSGDMEEDLERLTSSDSEDDYMSPQASLQAGASKLDSEILSTGAANRVTCPAKLRVDMSQVESKEVAIDMSQANSAQAATSIASEAEVPTQDSDGRAQGKDSLTASSNPLLQDPELHLVVLKVAVGLLLTPCGSLNALYYNPQLRTHSYLQALHLHLSYNLPRLASPLQQWADSSDEPTQRLVRLLCKGLFHEKYRKHDNIGHSYQSEVYTCSTESACNLVLKAIDVDKTDGTGLVIAFEEVGVLQRLKHLRGVCRLVDYGLTAEGAALVMLQYRCNLRQWRDRYNALISKQPTLLYLNIFAQLVHTVQELHQEQVVHFDLKCDNILLNLEDGVTDQELYQPLRNRLPCTMVLADFGESCDFKVSRCTFSSREHGTTCNQAPEMVSENNASFPQDVWSLGCLLYELITGCCLFPAEAAQLISLFGEPDKELLTPTRLHLVQHMPDVVDLLNYILQKDPAQRPSAVELQARVQQHLLHLG